MSRELIAGRELDALVAQEVMGFRVEKRGIRLVELPPRSFEPNPWGGQRWRNLPRYSAQIAAAWEILPVMLTNGFRLDLRVDDEGARAYFDNFSVFYEAHAESAPHAVCLAALKAVEAKEPLPAQPSESPVFGSGDSKR